MTLTFGPPKNGWDFKGKNKATSETYVTDEEPPTTYSVGLRAYIAGPMRGYDRFNFPAFDRAESQLKKKGWDAVSPAAMDRAIGVNENTTELPDGFIYTALRRDFAAICTCDAIVFLPEWEKSSGARAEARVGLDIGLRFFSITPRGKLVELYREEVAARV